MRHRPIAALAAALVTLAAPGVASAAITTTTVTSPTGAVGLLHYDNGASKYPLTVTGTSDGASGDPVDIRCEYLDFTGAPQSRLIGSGTLATGGGFTVAADASSLIYFPCRLAAVPGGTTPSDLSAFHGAVVHAFASDDTNSTSGPNNGKTFNYYDALSQTRGYSDYASIGSCGLDDAQMFGATVDSQGEQRLLPYTFYCNGFYPSNMQPTTGNFRAGARIDGHDAFFSYSGHTIQADGAWAGIQHSATYDAAADRFTITETDSPTECPANVTGAATNSGNCSTLSSSGVTVKRTMVTDHQGLVTRQTDVWSTSGPAHNVDLLDQQDFQFDSGNNGYRFPGQTSLATHVKGDMVTIPASSSPASILYTYDNTAGDGLGNPRASTTLWPVPDSAQFLGATSYLLHYNFTIPANGSFTIDRVYSSETTLTDLAPLTAAAEDRLGVPTVALTAPADGAVVNSPTLAVTGTASDNAAVTGVTVNGKPVNLSGGAFSTTLTLVEGANPITAVATDSAGNTATVTHTVTLQIPQPPAKPTITRTGKPKLTVKGSSATVDLGETVACPSGGSACTVAASLTTVKAFAAAAKKRKVKLASKTFTVAPGASLKIKLKLSSKGLKLLRAKHKLSVAAAIAAVAGVGGTPVKAARTFSIKAPAKKKKH